ncbi:hypothetical protein BsWGS_18971 [Bradybaena similaris]
MFVLAVVLLAHFSSNSVPQVSAEDAGKRACQLGLHNHHCAFIDMERLKNAGNFLRSAGSPSKRSGEADFGLPEYQITSDELRAANVVLEGLVEQRQAIATLRRLLVAMRADMDSIRNTKRNCRFRLGGHCLTESLDRVATSYYYLKSPNSPGRRRRHVKVTNNRPYVY